VADATSSPTIAIGARPHTLLPAMTNRHGLVTGATGTGKTVTIHSIAEQLSDFGVPVFLADVKGDLAGISQPAGENPKVAERVATLKLTDWAPSSSPVLFWDIFGQEGHPIRTTVSEMGPILLGRLLDLNDTQTGVLHLAFKYADDEGLLLLDLKDLRALLQYVGDNRETFTTEYGNVSAASIGAIQRSLLALEEGGGDALFGEPALDLADFMRVTADGKGMVSLLSAGRLMASPKIYATFLLWLLAELFEQLPEVGDPEKPKLVFFFDEAHLLFTDAPDALREKIEQIVRLIRSKGVGVFFITQNPLDIPDTVLGQLGNRLQHALRAYTPRDQKAVKTAAETFRANPDLDVAQTITELGVGEVLVSFLDEKGVPEIVDRALVIPPRSQIGPITPEQRAGLIAQSPVAATYTTAVDRESAYELLKARADAAALAAEQKAAAAEAAKEMAKAEKEAEAERARAEKAAAKEAARVERESRSRSSGRSRRDDNDLGDIAMSAARSFGSQAARSIVRGILGSLSGSRR
jgi:DNA helicase HerA-like ATPase